ncbi:MAG: glucose-6-phosphate isomerase, partial [Beijerinckiaceae bacterium]
MHSTELTTAVQALEAHRRDNSSVTIADLFVGDPKRFDDFHIEPGDIFFDFSKHRISRQALALLIALARAAKVEERRADLFGGAIVNPTEKRPALHMALRNLSGAPMF